MRTTRWGEIAGVLQLIKMIIDTETMVLNSSFPLRNLSTASNGGKIHIQKIAHYKHISLRTLGKKHLDKY